MIRHLTAPLLTLVLLATLPLLVAQDRPSTGDRANAAAPAGAYEIDPAHTSIYFKIGHLGISEIYGRFNDFAGDFTLGENPRFDVTIDTASIDTGITRRDDHLRSPDFFDARQYPQIEFQTTSVQIEDDRYTLTGDFTMHGQTRQLTLPLTYLGQVEAQDQQRVGFTGSTTIDRRDWGISGFDGVVGHEVTLLISFEGIRQ